MALKSAVKVTGKPEVVLEESPLSDSQSTALVQDARKIVQGLITTRADAVEGGYSVKIPKEPAAFPWRARRALAIFNRFSAGIDGNTPYQRLKGKRFIPRAGGVLGMCRVRQIQQRGRGQPRQLVGTLGMVAVR